VAYLPKEKTEVVVFTTTGPDSPPGTHCAGAIVNRVGAIVAPASPPAFLANR
jgi:hypothetical protein